MVTLVVPSFGPPPLPPPMSEEEMRDLIMSAMAAGRKHSSSFGETDEKAIQSLAKVTVQAQ